MKRRSLYHLAAFVVLALGVFPALGEGEEEVDKKLKSYRAAFEKRMNTELDEHGLRARELRKKYIDALKRLKSDLGKAENLPAAAQVVAEIEAVEDGEEAKPLPKNADYRFRNVRKKWDDGLKAILDERRIKIKKTAALYFKALDEEKRKLTRAGNIKEALAFEEEAKRVKELPEIKTALEEPEEPASDPKEGPPKGTLTRKDLAGYLEDTVWEYRVHIKGRPTEMRTIMFLPDGKARFAKRRAELTWEVVKAQTVTLRSAAWGKHFTTLVFDAELAKFAGENSSKTARITGADRTKRRR